MSAQIKGVLQMNEALPPVNESIFVLDMSVRLCQMIEDAEHRHDLGVRAEVEGREGTVYLRVGKRRLENQEQRVVYIARVNIEPQYRRRGLFNEILRRASRCAVMYSCGLYIENVQNEDLVLSLPRHGFKQMEYSVPPSFYKTVNRLRQEHAYDMEVFMGIEKPEARHGS